MRRKLPDTVHPQRRRTRRNLLQLPSVFHGAAEACRHGGPCRSLPEKVRQGTGDSGATHGGFGCQGSQEGVGSAARPVTARRRREPRAKTASFGRGSQRSSCCSVENPLDLRVITFRSRHECPRQNAGGESFAHFVDWWAASARLLSSRNSRSSCSFWRCSRSASSFSYCWIWSALRIALTRAI